MSAFKVARQNSARQVSRIFLGLSLPIVSCLGLIGSPSIAATSPIKPAPELSESLPKLPNGVYLYGQSNKPDELGQAYFVFEVTQGKVLGALYMPQSSFDCAYGGFQRDRVALNVVDSYEKKVFSYEIALDRTATIASNTNIQLNPPGLDGFQKLEKVSQNDLRMLKTCKDLYQAKIR